MRLDTPIRRHLRLFPGMCVFALPRGAPLRDVHAVSAHRRRGDSSSESDMRKKTINKTNSYEFRVEARPRWKGAERVAPMLVRKLRRALVFHDAW